MNAKVQNESRRPTRQMSARLATRWGWLPLILALLSGFSWLISLPGTNPREMTDLGLLSVLPGWYFLALLMLTGSFMLAVFTQPGRRWLLMLHLGLLIVYLHATPSLIYGTLRYSWAWKHVGMVDYIQRHGAVDPSEPILNAYHNWPGFFALNTLLTEAAGLTSALPYAAWATLFFNLLFLGALLLVYRSLTPDPRLGWMAVWFFFVSNWVGQDYFSPQTFAYFLYLVLVGVLLRWFRFSRSPAFLRSGFLARLRPSGWMYARIQQAAMVPKPALPPQRVVLMALVVLIVVVITFSHQLTPVIVFGALLLLVAFQQVWTKRLPVLAFVLMAAWIWFMASGFVGENLRSLLGNLGDVEGNVTKNLIDLNRASPGMVVVSYVGRVVSLLVMVLAMLGFLWRLRGGWLDLSALLLMGAPFFMLVANSYGGEVLFRIYFFALPFMAFYIACLFYPRPHTSVSWITPVAATAVSVLVMTGLLFGYYGKEKQYFFTPEEVAAATFLYENGEPGALIVEGTRNYPSLFRNYERYTYVPIAREPEEGRERIMADPAGVLESWMRNPEYARGYLLLTRSMMAEIDTVGEMPTGSLQAIGQALLASERFEVLYENHDAVIFGLREQSP
jgi:hypothetical protein